MLNRRILRIKAFKVLYGKGLSEDMTLAQAQSQLDLACEATRDLYIYMLGIVSPLTAIARERIEAAKSKFNPTEEERNPNMKFVQNALASFLESDIDFQKIYAKKKFDWLQYDLFLKKVVSSLSSKDYYMEYMASPETSLAEDCRLFTRIFEEEFVDSEELERILEDKSLYWNDDLAYSLTWCCKTFSAIAKGQGWTLPPLYMSDVNRSAGTESDSLFVKKLLQASFAGFEKYGQMIADAAVGWEKDRLYSTDVVLIVMGLAEAASFPTIPVKVTINEYVELSKFYGTQKSRSFVNGLLDRLIQSMTESGEIVKEGRGLL